MDRLLCRIIFPVILTVLVTLSTICLVAQQPVPAGASINIRIENIGVAQGLSQGMIHALDVDQTGYLWIATKDGLNKYDGTHFQVFRNNPRDPTSIASNYIRCVHVDDRGLIWVGTNSSGLELFNPTNARFIHFGKQLSPDSESSLQNVVKIMSSPSGRILLWDAGGLHGELLSLMPGQNPFSVNAWKTQSIGDVYKLSSDLPAPTSLNIVGFGPENELIYHEDNILFVLSRDSVNVIQLPLNNPVKATVTPLLYREYIFFLDSDRNLFGFSNSSQTIFAWHAVEKKLKPWLQLTGFTMDPVSTMFFDHEGRIWCDINQPYMYRIDPQKGVAARLDFIDQDVQQLRTEHFSIWREDKQHNIWAGSSGYGLYKIAARNDQFVLADADQLGVQYVKEGSGFLLHDTYTIGEEARYLKQLEKNASRLCMHYAEDKQKHLWMLLRNAKGEYGLHRFLPGMASTNFFPVALCTMNLGEDAAYLMADRADNIWMGYECSDGKAWLLKYQPATGHQEHYSFPVEVLHTEHGFISDWHIDAQGVFWIGSRQGLFKFNPGTGEWKKYEADFSGDKGLSNEYVLSICPDPLAPTTYLWIGTDGGGLNKMDVVRETFVHYQASNSRLPNDVIYAVQPDSHGKLWLSSNLGICRFDPETQDVWSFTAADGLQGNEFNRCAYGRKATGMLFFSGINGATVFDPEVFYTGKDASPIVINRLKLANKEVKYSPDHAETAGGFVLPAPIETCTKLIFNYTDRMITLGFALLDFTNPAGNQYRYKLENFNQDWIEAGNEQEAVFTNLGPGTYHFFVEGRNSQHVWSAPAQLTLVILSPWWATWWFRSAIVVAVLAAIYAFYQYRLRQAMKIQHLRNRIAADLHDEIGSTLSSISLAGTVIQHKLKTKDPEVNGLLDKITQHTQSMMEAMSDIVWAVNAKHDRFDQVLNRMRAFAVEMLEPKDILVHFEASPAVAQLHLDMQQRKNFYLLFKEVINNAAKYSQAQHVRVSMAYQHGNLRMEVSDDGVGFDIRVPATEQMPGVKLGGNGIQNMQQRARELKGTLEIQSSPGQGTNVILQFPV